ncbi:hypothetical protein L3i23_01480 [Herbiconiux sp. L3-i23]|nr:hypothetical protein L3i23_01480 [Herbiconiux sp. L3-i23]
MTTAIAATAIMVVALMKERTTALRLVVLVRFGAPIAIRRASRDVVTTSPSNPVRRALREPTDVDAAWSRRARRVSGT